MYRIHQLSAVYPPGPKFTEKDLPSLQGKVYAITGGNAGIGKALAKMLYAKDAKIYIFSRSAEKAQKAIEEIKAESPSSKGELIFQQLDLADLSTIKASAQAFLAREDKLHVLFNNAGVMIPKTGRTPQGYEPQMGINTIGPFLFTKLVTPLLSATAKTQTTPGTVRVIWVGSSAAEGMAPSGGMPQPIGGPAYYTDNKSMGEYGISKAGNYFHGTEYARRHPDIVSIPLNPGNLKSDLWVEHGSTTQSILNAVLLHPVKNGAYTELFAGLSPAVTMEKSGSWVGPWGRFLVTRSDFLKAAKPKEEGGSGLAAEFWDWTEEQVKKFA